MEDFVNVDEIQISTDSSRTDNGDYNITTTTKIFIHLTINHRITQWSDRQEKWSKSCPSWQDDDDEVLVCVRRSPDP